MAPEGELPPGAKQVLKPTPSQALLAQPPMETLDVRVLRGFALLNDQIFNVVGVEGRARAL
jgi:hypothetical protein